MGDLPQIIDTIFVDLVICMYITFFVVNYGSSPFCPISSYKEDLVILT